MNIRRCIKKEYNGTERKPLPRQTAVTIDRQLLYRDWQTSQRTIATITEVDNNENRWEPFERLTTVTKKDSHYRDRRP